MTFKNSKKWLRTAAILMTAFMPLHEGIAHYNTRDSHPFGKPQTTYTERKKIDAPPAKEPKLHYIILVHKDGSNESIARECFFEQTCIVHEKDLLMTRSSPTWGRAALGIEQITKTGVKLKYVIQKPDGQIITNDNDPATPFGETFAINPGKTPPLFKIEPGTEEGTAKLTNIR